MRNMIAWKFRHMIHSIPFYMILMGSMIVALAYIPISISDGVESSFDLLLQTQSRIASIMDLFGGLYIALCITHDMQNRSISAAMMTGNSLFSILFSEYFAVACTIFASVFIPSISAFAIGSVILGIGGGSLAECIFTAVFASFIYSLMAVAAFSIAVPFSFIIKGEGSSCIVNLLLLILLWSGVQGLIELEQGSLVSFTPFGQLFFLCDGDLSAGTAGMALGIASVFIAVQFVITYLILKKMEMK